MTHYLVYIYGVVMVTIFLVGCVVWAVCTYIILLAAGKITPHSIGDWVWRSAGNTEEPPEIAMREWRVNYLKLDRETQDHWEMLFEMETGEPYRTAPIQERIIPDAILEWRNEQLRWELEMMYQNQGIQPGMPSGGYDYNTAFREISGAMPPLRTMSGRNHVRPLPTYQDPVRVDYARYQALQRPTATRGDSRT